MNIYTVQTDSGLHLSAARSLLAAMTSARRLSLTDGEMRVVQDGETLYRYRDGRLLTEAGNATRFGRYLSCQYQICPACHWFEARTYATDGDTETTRCGACFRVHSVKELR